MLFTNLVTVDCEHLGRSGIESLSDQSAMELLVSNFVSKEPLQDENGDIKDIGEWGGLEISADARVQSIYWYHNLLYSERNREKVSEIGRIELQWLPREVTEFSVYDMRMSGTIDTSRLPRSLEFLDVSINDFSGTFAIEFLPSTMTLIVLIGNRFEGTLNMSALPKSIVAFDVSSNQFSGSIELSKLPDKLETLSLGGNRFSGEINLHVLPPLLDNVDLRQNNLRQDVLVIGGNLHTLKVDSEMFGKILHSSGQQLNIRERHSELCINIAVNE